jgi:ATP phosphoribosyltransferase regulatory subunit
VDNASPVDGAGAPRGRAGGFSDWLPGPAARRRAVTDAFLDTFAAWGYGLVATPLLEPVDTVAAGIGAGRQTSLFRFMDADGSLLALVGERTVSVARVVATQLRDGPFPLRLCYAGPVLRNQALLGGRRRETLQAGCELIGSPGLAADAECVALAARALESAGLGGVQIDVGHADFLPGLLEGAGLDDATRERVLQALQDRDLVAVEAALEGTEVGDAERSLLLRFPALRGGRDILDAAAQGLRAERPLRALDELRRLWDLLAGHGLNGGVLHLDLGAVRDWDYYTGPTFELFTRDLGFPLGAGGRYDSLLARLGLPLPATGFVVYVDRCCDALLRRESQFAAPSPLRIGWAEGRGPAALQLAESLRARGVAVATDLDPSATPADGVHAYIDSNGTARWRMQAMWRSGSLDDTVAALAPDEPAASPPVTLERRGA